MENIDVEDRIDLPYYKRHSGGVVMRILIFTTFLGGLSSFSPHLSTPYFSHPLSPQMYLAHPLTSGCLAPKNEIETAIAWSVVYHLQSSPNIIMGKLTRPKTASKHVQMDALLRRRRPWHSYQDQDTKFLDSHKLVTTKLSLHSKGMLQPPTLEK